MTQREFLESPACCTYDVLQKILEAARQWYQHRGDFVVKDDKSLIVELAEEQIKFCDLGLKDLSPEFDNIRRDQQLDMLARHVDELQCKLSIMHNSLKETFEKFHQPLPLTAERGLI
ncbi:MAG: hypothetical protein Q8K86_07030 [Candidatus Nanopelagicaceae bacterium]|nr:hypothetical protein [Candidatus Nanopelagicaceae bacterium]